MKRIITGLALGTSLLAFTTIAGTGLFLAGVEQSGERGLGVILIVGGMAAFAAVLLLAFAPAAYFRPPMGKAIGALAALVGLLPVAALSAATFTFVGLPYGSVLPRLDWALFAAGLVFGLGAVCIAALGFSRTAARADRASGRQAPPVGRGGETDNPEALLYAPLTVESARRVVDDDRRSVGDDDEIRVTRV